MQRYTVKFPAILVDNNPFWNEKKKKLEKRISAKEEPILIEINVEASSASEAVDSFAGSLARLIDNEASLCELAQSRYDIFSHVRERDTSHD